MTWTNFSCAVDDMSGKPPAIFLMGPTAAGKTDLAIELTKVLPCELISVDSALVYRGMDIGTAKPSKDVLAAHPHRLIDILDPAESYSAAQFCTDALEAMAEEARPKGDGSAGWGVLLYLRQEGRGIGLINKLRAYSLQDQGFDTVDANNRLGLPTEARDFPVAARMLALLGVHAIRLMTNNPAKVAALVGEGVSVVERVPHRLPPNPHNQRYLATKRDRTGHIL